MAISAVFTVDTSSEFVILLRFTVGSSSGDGDEKHRRTAAVLRARLRSSQVNGCYQMG
jgi:hypothetical protein